MREPTMHLTVHRIRDLNACVVFAEGIYQSPRPSRMQ
ncbi:hypothetical protein T4E_8626 [Trichinella pseudospiralis]|uniref:Uncharacterized protein n=1 Tax=Trichinella pseudospiralis TaxID=6337 RepID=A0A0V0W4G3_TRIPS|nr:hypothetical protein T4E_8626 [Trichinella pseudospiralis]